MLYILRAGLPDVSIVSLFPLEPTFPFMLVRKTRGLGTWQGDPRFTDSCLVEVQTLVEDPNGDEDAALLAEAVRVVLRNAWLAHTVVPGLGSVIEISLHDEPRRVTDWATSAGPVQYAELPSGVWRYETTYEVSIRKAR